MNPIGFALAGAVLLTTSLAAFDTFGQDASGQGAPTASARIVRSEASPVAAERLPVTAATAEAPRRAVRVILSSPYDRQG